MIARDEAATVPRTLGFGSADPIVELLLSGAAETAHDAEALYLDTHVPDVIHLVESPLSEAEFRRHPLIVLLLGHGSRGREDALS